MARQSGFKKCKKGPYKPINPQKYMGDPTKIIYRSAWELRFMYALDTDPTVIGWSSEEIAIPYLSPKDKKMHRYYPDFIVKRIIKGLTKTIMYEVKPKEQTVMPKSKHESGKAKPRKTQLNEAMTFGVNSAKWRAAREYCANRQWDFVILTEDDLGIKTK